MESIAPQLHSKGTSLTWFVCNLLPAANFEDGKFQDKILLVLEIQELVFKSGNSFRSKLLWWVGIFDSFSFPGAHSKSSICVGVISAVHMVTFCRWHHGTNVRFNENFTISLLFWLKSCYLPSWRHVSRQSMVTIFYCCVMWTGWYRTCCREVFYSEMLDKWGGNRNENNAVVFFVILVINLQMLLYKIVKPQMCHRWQQVFAFSAV